MLMKQNHWVEQNEGYQEPCLGGIIEEKSNYSHWKRKEVAAVNTDGDCPPESGSERKERGKVRGPCSNSLITSFLYDTGYLG